LFILKLLNEENGDSLPKTVYQFFLRKMLGTRYGLAGTRFPSFQGLDDNFLWFYWPESGP